MSWNSLIFGIAAAALSLTACAHEDAAPSYAWSYQQDEYDGAKLAYGAPNSDDVVMMMTCEPGSGRVLMSALVKDARPDLVLASGKGQRTFEALGGTSEIDGGAIVEAEADARGPVFGQFAETGELSMLTGGDKVSLAAKANERPTIGRFFETCGQA